MKKEIFEKYKRKKQHFKNTLKANGTYKLTNRIYRTQYT